MAAPLAARLAALLVVLSVPLAALMGGCGPIWYLDAGFAQRVAEQEKKPLLLYFKAWDSTQHRNMKMNVFEHPPVKKELMETVNAELEFAWAPDIARRYGVQRPQVCVMCTPDGNKVSTSMYVNPVPSEKEFLDWLVKAKAEAMPKATSEPATEEKTAEKPQDEKADVERGAPTPRRP
ncbi:MAG: hypothetical protein JXQ75_03385 [Phycisphaerae bacterium]|nr:hypothetical protein [Phycisphaerae bacterium]